MARIFAEPGATPVKVALFRSPAATRFELATPPEIFVSDQELAAMFEMKFPYASRATEYTVTAPPVVTSCAGTTEPVPSAAVSTRTCVAGELTVSRKLLLAVKEPSLTITVIVAVPASPATGVTVTVRLVPAPPKTMLFVGTKFVFAEDADRTRLATGVSRS